MIEVKLGLLGKRLKLDDKYFYIGNKKHKIENVLEVTYSFPEKGQRGLLQIITNNYGSLPSIIGFSKGSVDDVTNLLLALGEKEINLIPKNPQALNSKINKTYPGKLTCPRCGSGDLMAGDKKLSIGRSIGGAVIAGPVGAIIGGLSSKKAQIKCLSCGHSWTAGKRI